VPEECLFEVETVLARVKHSKRSLGLYASPWIAIIRSQQPESGNKNGDYVVLKNKGRTGIMLY